MSTVGPEEEPGFLQWFAQSLQLRVVLFLTLALLPIGLLSVWQTRELGEVADRRANLSLIALAEISLGEERGSLERAFGAVAGLAAAVPHLVDDPEACSDAVTDFAASYTRLTFVGFLPRDNMVTCSTAGRDVDVSAHPLVPRLIDTEMPVILAETEPAISSEPVLVLVHPVRDGDRRLGHLLLSLSLSEFMARLQVGGPDAPDEIAIFNEVGELIAYVHDGDETEVPPDPGRFLFTPGAAPTVVRDDVEGQAGGATVFQPFVGNLLYAFVAWNNGTPTASTGVALLPVALLPIAMLLGSLVVAYFAVHRLVVRHIQALRRKMRIFARTRALPRAAMDYGQPLEIQELESTFAMMAFDLIDDEARMEDALREKNILLKEVHHRVKNNLQLISSIMNMDIRRTENPETRHVLKRLQDRVLGIATVHRYLYQAKDLSRSNGAELAKEVFSGIFNTVTSRRDRVKLTFDMDTVMLLPDQAVPLALLCNEIGTNALKHIEGDDLGQHFVAISLKMVGADAVTLSCTNSLVQHGSKVPAPAKVTEMEDGLGRQLIRAFATQLDAIEEIDETDKSFTISFTFDVVASIPMPRDY